MWHRGYSRYAWGHKPSFGHRIDGASQNPQETKMANEGFEYLGVNHVALVCRDMKETVDFYTNVLEMPLVKTIQLGDRGQHFFFDAGKGATIAFFYYIGTDRPEKFIPEDHYFYSATHTAWGVDNPEQLKLWKETLEKRGVTVSPFTRHEILESIYFRDPNGYPLEVTLRLRDMHMLDAKDAEMTLEAAMQLEDESRAGKERLRDIDTVWRRKAKLVEEYITAE